MKANFSSIGQVCDLISKDVGVDTTLMYRARDGRSYLLWFGWDMPNEGKYTHRDVTFFREGELFVNNRFKRVVPIELTKAMPCLLKGGKAAIGN